MRNLHIRRAVIWALIIVLSLSSALMHGCKNNGSGDVSAENTPTVNSPGNTETDSVGGNESLRPGDGNENSGETAEPSGENTGDVNYSDIPGNTYAPETLCPESERPVGIVTEQPENNEDNSTESAPVIKPTDPPTARPEATPYATEPDYSKIKPELLPRILITTEGGQAVESKDYYVKAKISMSSCAQEYAFSNSSAGIRVRGNSTAVAPKKPYRIKFDTKQSMLGLNDGKTFKSWCLMADYYDGTMLRTWATFKFAEVLLEGKYYSSDCAPVEVYINGEFMGVYLLCEQTQIKKNRVNVPEKADGSTDVEIGYLMIGQGGRNDEPETVVVYPQITVYDRQGESMYFEGLNFALSGDDYTDAQKEYVSKYTSAVFKVVAAAIYENKYYTLKRDGTMVPKTSFKGKTEREKQIETIDAVFNIESAVAMCVLDEIAKNLDAMTFNMYVDLSPQGDGRLTLAAPWDFDFAMGNTHYATTHSTSGFYATNLSYSEGMRTNLWYVMLGKVDWFEEMCSELWKKHYSELKSIAWETMVMSCKYPVAYQMDYSKWGLPANRSLIHHHCTEDLNKIKTHKDAGMFLKNWLISRLIWLDTRWGYGLDATTVTQSPLLLIDLTDPDNISYLTGFKRCQGTITDKGLKLTQTEARDPYFYVDLTHLADSFSADDYPFLEITCMRPKTNSDIADSGEIFLCSGSYTDAVGGISSYIRWEGKEDQYYTYRIDLSSTGFWSGKIHKIRVDFFNACQPGDTMYITEINFRTA